MMMMRIIIITLNIIPAFMVQCTHHAFAKAPTGASMQNTCCKLLHSIYFTYSGDGSVMHFMPVHSTLYAREPWTWSSRVTVNEKLIKSTPAMCLPIIRRRRRRHQMAPDTRNYIIAEFLCSSNAHSFFSSETRKCALTIK